MKLPILPQKHPCHSHSTAAWPFFALALVGLLPAMPATAATFNVQTYGATGNGSTDDTQAIQKTIAAAAAAGAGSVVYFPAGSYLYSTPFTFNSLTVQGASEANTFLIAADPNNSSLTLTGTNPAAYGLTITTTTAPTVRNSNPSGTGIQVFQAAGFTISYVKIVQMASAGILVRQSMGAASGARAQIENCEIAKTLADGIHVTQVSSNLEIHDNYVHDTGDDFIGVVSARADGGTCSNILIHNNTAERQTNGRGIAIVGGTNLQIYNNRVMCTVASGIYLASESGYDTYGVDTVNIHDNLLKNCPKAAIAGHAGMIFSGRADPTGGSSTVLWVTNVTATDNTIMNSATYGVVVGAQTGYVSLVANLIDFTTNDGISIYGGSSGTNCAGNTIVQAGGNGISVLAGAIDVAIVANPVSGLGNTICDTGLYGIYVDATGTATTMAISDNIIDSVNLNKTTYVDVIVIRGAAATGANISILNNRYMNPAGEPVNRLIESIYTSLSQVSGNTSTVSLPSLYTLL